MIAASSTPTHTNPAGGSPAVLYRLSADFILRGQVIKFAENFRRVFDICVHTYTSSGEIADEFSACLKAALENHWQA